MSIVILLEAPRAFPSTSPERCKWRATPAARRAPPRSRPVSAGRQAPGGLRPAHGEGLAPEQGRQLAVDELRRGEPRPRVGPEDLLGPAGLFRAGDLLREGRSSF